MRAIFESSLIKIEKGETYSVKDDSFHHLANVVRVKLNETVKIFNGQGLEVLTEVMSVEKKQVLLKVLEVIHHSKSEILIDAYIGTPKKEALELCLKQAVELGINKVLLAETEFAQKHFLNEDRQLALLVSSLEQSNNPFLPEITNIGEEKLDLSDYDQVLLFDSVNQGELSGKASGRRFLVVLGPEGGFSESELAWWKSHSKTVSVHLPTAIMRTPTALSCAIGFTLGKLN